MFTVIDIADGVNRSVLLKDSETGNCARLDFHEGSEKQFKEFELDQEYDIVFKLHKKKKVEGEEEETEGDEKIEPKTKAAKKAEK